MVERVMPGLRPARWLVAAGLAATALWAAQPAAHAVSAAVSIKDASCLPGLVTVLAGDSVIWTNNDAGPRGVRTSNGPEKFESPQLGPGDAWSRTFPVRGTYEYTCGGSAPAKVIVR